MPRARRFHLAAHVVVILCKSLWFQQCVRTTPGFHRLLTDCTVILFYEQNMWFSTQMISFPPVQLQNNVAVA